MGISIIHAGQVIPGLTLARILRDRYPHLHIVIGGSVFARHQDILKDKKKLFEEMFHSIILFEGEHPLDQLIKRLKDGKSLDTVPNLIYVKNEEVVRNSNVKALPPRPPSHSCSLKFARRSISAASGPWSVLYG